MTTHQSFNTDPHSHGQSSRRKSWSQIKSARVKLMPVNEGRHQSPPSPEAPIPSTTAPPFTGQTQELQTHSSIFAGTVLQAGESLDTTDIHTSSQQGNTQQHTETLVHGKLESRRGLLLGTMAGVSGIVGVSIIGLFLDLLFSKGNSTTPNRKQNTSTPTSTNAGSRAVIAQVSAVARNDASPFTLPSTGHPGVLIHLPNDQFVAYDAICTHQDCRVAYDPPSQHLICPCHGATYDPAQRAAVLAGPTSFPLKSVPIHIDSATGAITIA